MTAADTTFMVIILAAHIAAALVLAAVILAIRHLTRHNDDTYHVTTASHVTRHPRPYDWERAERSVTRFYERTTDD